MRTLTLFPMAIVLIHATAFAAPQSEPTGTPPLTVVQVPPLARDAYQPTPMEVAEVKGVYALDNGETMNIFVEGRELRAQIMGRLVTELTPVAENRFVSADQRLTVEFKPIAFGDQILLTYPANSAQASSAMITPRFADK